jgi:serine protease Do
LPAVPEPDTSVNSQTETEGPEVIPAEIKGNTIEEKREVFAFEWKYTDEAVSENNSKKNKKTSRRGAVVYAIIMCAAFLLAFTILAVSISFDNFANAFKTPDRELSITEIVEKGMPSTVLIYSLKDDNMGSCGSGFVVNDYGYVVTNHHVIEETLQIVVVDSNDVQYSAELVNSDAKLDLALLYVEGLTAPEVTLANSDKAKMGETVVAIGCPAGSGEALSVSNGIISGFDRSVSHTNVGMIQTNAPLNPGNSGGPLFDAYGNVVGIVESKLMYDTNVDGEKIPLDGIAYAIPINAAKSKIVEWIETDLTKPMLGIHAISVEENEDYFYSAAEGKIYLYVNEQGKNYSINSVGEKKELADAQINDPENMIVHADKTGLLVVGITEGLGAYGKLERGDILVELNGEPTSNTAEVRAIFTKLSAGDTVEVKVYRNGEPLVMKMTVKTKGDMLAAEYDK